MYSEYLSAVVRRALQPTIRVTDGLQILAASALPALADATGTPVPATDHVLGYIGAAAVAYIVLRLFFVAPYQVWREQVGEIGTLKLELSKPERIEQERMARARAKKRIQLAALIREAHWHAFTDRTNEGASIITANFARGLTLMGQAGLPESFVQAFTTFCNSCTELHKDRRGLKADKKLAGHSFSLSDDMIDFLHGRITAEALALRLPKDTEPEKQQ